jgi:enoyl-CoA hydratase/carnithine racemase
MAEPGPLCIYEKRDPHIAIIKLNRPEKKNAISRDLYWALDEAWHKAKDDDDVWTIISDRQRGRFLLRRRLERKLAFAKGEMTGPRSGPRPYSTPASLQCTSRSFARNQRLCGRRRLSAWRCHAISATACRQRSSAAPKCAGRIWPLAELLCQIPRVGLTGFALTGQMVDADTAFRSGWCKRSAEPDKLIDDCIELATTINRNGRLIAQHTMEFVEDKLLYGIQGWEKASRFTREFYAHLRRARTTTKDQPHSPNGANRSFLKSTTTRRPSYRGVPVPKK